MDTVLESVPAPVATWGRPISGCFRAGNGVEVLLTSNGIEMGKLWALVLEKNTHAISAGLQKESCIYK